ncbi:MAG: OST-HTH/LOTUS domain-containing protein [Rhodoferax sp.]
MVSDVAQPPADALENLERTVQRKLGRCMIRLQQYENLLKQVVAHAQIAGLPEQLPAIQEAQVACAHKKTLGTLVGMLTEGYLTPAGRNEAADEDPQLNEMWFRFSCRIELDTDERYQAITTALKELVDLRNELVHHFLQRFNIWNPAGCTAAEAYLDVSYQSIDTHYLTLQQWAQGMDSARAMAASFLSSPQFKDLLFDGIAPDGSIDWPASGAVRCLRAAETLHAATKGWVHLNTAIAWIRQEHPTQHPQRYGCGSWRQVIHESQQFEIRKSMHPETGAGEVWYRSRKE